VAAVKWCSLKLGVLLCALLLFGADRASKLAVERQLELGRPRPLLGDTLRLTHVRNQGVVFGLWSGGNRWLITTVSLLVLGVILYYFLSAPCSRSLLLVSLGLVMAGAAGNLWDRLLRGYVTDFVDLDLGFMRWPAFNLADACICVGVVLMALDAMRPEPAGEPEGGRGA
jgi:signal peptidase II